MSADEGREDTTTQVPARRPRSNGAEDPANISPSVKRASRRQSENAIQAGRERRRARAALEAAPAVSADRKVDSPRIPRADTDPWTVPASVRDRFVQDGHRFYFPDGAPAFRDLGRRLTTASENTQVVHSLIEIARTRGWNEITVTGTERFRHEAWRQGRLAGLTVRGFKPSEEQQTQLVRALGRSLPRAAERQDGISEEAPPAAPQATDPLTAPNERPERMAGKLLDHGRDAYRHDPNAEPSYFVRLETRDGRREVWGKDLERAIVKSLTQPKVGDEIVLKRTGRDTVTVTRRERDAAGALSERNVGAWRNRWVIERQDFFEERERVASLVRDERIDPKTAVRRHPELAGTYLSLRAAELTARRLTDPEDQKRFLTLVRRALADDIERGEPLPPVRLRERGRVTPVGTPPPKTRTPTREDLERTA